MGKKLRIAPPKKPKSANYGPNGCGRHHNAIGFSPEQAAVAELPAWIRSSINYAARWAAMSANRLEEGADKVKRIESVLVHGTRDQWWAMTDSEKDALIEIAMHLASSKGRVREIRLQNLAIPWPFLMRLITETPSNVALEIWGEHGCIAILPDGSKYIRIDTGSLARMRARHATAAGASG